MARKKLNDDEKRSNFSITMDEKLNNILEEYLIKKGISNKSKYIESLVKKDMIDRGEDIKEEY
jgi:metal-responsive CopG/Arc/MetJ family transcriptional regulator